LGDPDVPVSLVADVNDPFEPVNRVIFGFNEIVDFSSCARSATSIAASCRSRCAPASATPAQFRHPGHLRQRRAAGRPEQAKTTFVRFLVNSTAGFGGLVDAAAAGGLPRHSEDFGQTLAVWGAGPAPISCCRCSGRRTTRDTVGLGVDTVCTRQPG
jgi:phospholipid-binding lipoprotein MlaA